jgi:hypothetical protein
VDVEKHVNAKPITEAMDVAVGRALDALEQPTGHYSDFHRANIQNVFLSMQSTQRAIRKILSWGNEDPVAIDALALARLPLEGLYTLSLMFEAPRWVHDYLRDGWRKQYESFLLQREETKDLSRCAEFNNRTGPFNIVMHAKAVGITKTQIASVEHLQLGTPLPEGVKYERIDRFPMPSGVIDEIQDGRKKQMLRRLYPEYSYLCSFAHGLPDANLFKLMFNKRSKCRGMWSETEVKDAFQRNVAERAYTTSLIAIIQSVAELTTLYPINIELRAGIVVAWKEMSEASLLGRAVWNLRTKALLGALS